MKSFDEIWRDMVARSPKLADDSATVHVRVSQFRLALSQVYDAGDRRGREIATQAAEYDAKRKPLGDIFGGLFG